MGRVSSEKGPEPIKKENDVEKEDKEEVGSNLTKLLQYEENTNYFTSEYVSQYKTKLDGKWKYVKIACIWNNAKDRYICQVDETATPSPLDVERTDYSESNNSQKDLTNAIFEEVGV